MANEALNKKGDGLIKRVFWGIVDDTHIGAFKCAAFSLSLFGVIRIVSETAERACDKLLPDVVGYKQIALNLRSPFATGVREPIVIWVSKVALASLNREDIAMRSAGAALFLVCALLVYKVTLSLAGHRWIALAASFLFLNNTLLVWLGAEGLRDLHFMLAVLIFAYFSFELLQGRLTGTTAALGIGLALVLGIGTRMTGFPAMAGHAAVIFWLGKVSWRKAVLALMVPVLFISPYLLYSKSTYGDYFWAINAHAVWWRNYEFVTLKKQPTQPCIDCPTQGELKAKGYYQGKATAWGYIISMRSPVGLAKHTAEGVAQLSLLPTKFFFLQFGRDSLWGWALYVVGLLSFVTDRKRILLLTIPYAILLPLFFTFRMMDTRLFSPLAPFLAVITALGAYSVALLLKRGLRIVA